MPRPRSERSSQATLRVHDDRCAELDAIVDANHVGVPHADASPADGVTEELRVWCAVDAYRPPVAVREPDPAITERILGPRGNALEDVPTIVWIDLIEVRMLDHLFDLEPSDRRLVADATDRDRK